MNDGNLSLLNSLIDNNDIDISLLFGSDIFGDIFHKTYGGSTLDALLRYGAAAAATDLVILTGGSIENTIMAPDEKSLKGRTAWYWTRHSFGFGKVRSCYNFEKFFDVDYDSIYGSIRPVLYLSPKLFSIITKNRVKGFNGTEEVCFGEYPQYVPDNVTRKLLENAYQNGNLQTTGKIYSIGGNNILEYEYNGNKYIRVMANLNRYKKHNRLSTDVPCKDGEFFWIQVSPVVWLIDDKSKKLVSKKCLVSGIRFDCEEYYGDFANTEMYRYLHNQMLKNLLQNTKDLDELFLKIKIGELKKDFAILREHNKRLRSELSFLREKNINTKSILRNITQNRNNNYDKKERFLANQLINNILEKHHISFDVTDFAILTNTKVDDPYLEHSSGNRCGYTRIGCTNLVYSSDGKMLTDDSGRGFAIRPIITSQIIYNELFEKSVLNDDGLRTVFFGEYPQDVPGKNMQKVLNKAFKIGSVTKSNECYTIISYGKSVQLPVYLYAGKKYVLVSADVAINNSRLSNNIKYKDGESTWVEVKPIEWIIDEKSQSLITKKGLIGNVDSSHLRMFYNEFLIEDILKDEKFSNQKDVDEIKRKLLLKSMKLVEKLKSNNITDRNIVIKELRSIIDVLKNVNVDTSNLEKIVFGFVR